MPMAAGCPRDVGVGAGPSVPPEPLSGAPVRGRDPIRWGGASGDRDSRRPRARGARRFPDLSAWRSVPAAGRLGLEIFQSRSPKRATGGTTVSATCELAAAAGILVFSTGGLGGVHRGASEHFDVSQDLGALARFPVAVVCAGAKSVLDLPKTLELLESLAVPVIGVGTAEFPGFYTRSTGIFLDTWFENAAEAAEIVRARRALGQGGAVFAVPPPACTESQVRGGRAAPARCLTGRPWRSESKGSP